LVKYFSKGDDKMPEMKIIDMTEVGRAVGVAEKEVIPPFPNAKPVLQQVWEPKDVENAVKYISDKYKADGGNVSIFGHVDTWICFAIVEALSPECNCHFATPNHDENDTFTHLPIYELSYGEPDPALQYQHEIREEGDFIYVKFNLGAEVEWSDLINKVAPTLTLPPIPEGKNLCISSDALYPLQWVVIGNYAKKANALFTAGHGTPPYRCAIPGTTSYKIGDEIPRV
jgi:hypothetical protein